MPQGSHVKAKGDAKKPKITRVSKKGSQITKKTPKKNVAQKKKLQKALEATLKTNVESELRTRAGGSGFTLDKKKPAPPTKGTKGRKGKKK